MPLARHAVAASREVALPSRNIPITASMDIFWQSKPHSRSGKPCKIPVTRTGPLSQVNMAVVRQCAATFIELVKKITFLNQSRFVVDLDPNLRQPRASSAHWQYVAYKKSVGI